MNAKQKAVAGMMVAMVTAMVGCERTSSTTATPPNSGTGMTGVGQGADVTGPRRFGTVAVGQGAGGAPSYGASAGNGFHVDNAEQGGAGGSGLEGFHGTGAAGTSGAITDAADLIEKPELGEGKTAPALNANQE